MWCADRDHGQLHRGASLRRAILPRRPCPAHRHRSACATSAEQGVPMKLHACTASLLVLAALLTGCQKSGPADPVADAGVAPAPAAAATADSAAKIGRETAWTPVSNAPHACRISLYN